MGLVLWIDQNTFATSLLEKVFKKKDLPFYTLEKATDIVYLVEDMRPTLIVLDGKTAKTHLSSLKEQYESSKILQSLPFVLIDSEGSDFPFLQHVVGRILRPFDPFEVPGKLQEILNFN